MQYPNCSTKWNSVIIYHFSVTSVITQHLGFHQGILSGREILQQTRRLRCQVGVVTTGSRLRWSSPHCYRWSHSPTSRFPSSPTPVVIIEPFSDRTHVERNAVWQTTKCVFAATSRQCHISSIPARWGNSTLVYNVYTLQTKLLLIGWRHTAHRSIRNITLLVVICWMLHCVWQVKVSVENVFHESTSEATVKTYTLTLSPTVVFRNWLPMDVSCKLTVLYVLVVITAEVVVGVAVVILIRQQVSGTIMKWNWCRNWEGGRPTSQETPGRPPNCFSNYQWLCKSWTWSCFKNMFTAS